MVKGCVMKGARVVVPRGLRAEVLKELHSDHQGIVRTKAIARSYVWWPGIDGDIENFVRSCLGCAQAQHMPRAVGLHPWEMPSGPWQRLHLDFAGPFLGKTFLILVDAYSKWPEVVPMAGTNAQSTIDVLMSVFAVHGLPTGWSRTMALRLLRTSSGNFVLPMIYIMFLVPPITLPPMGRLNVLCKHLKIT